MLCHFKFTFDLKFDIRYKNIITLKIYVLNATWKQVKCVKMCNKRPVRTAQYFPNFCLLIVYKKIFPKVTTYLATISTAVLATKKMHHFNQSIAQ